MRVSLAVALVLAGCEERYLIPQRALEGTIPLQQEKWQREVALPAIRVQDRANVWVLDGRVTVDSDPPQNGRVRARRTRPRWMTYVGGIVLTVPTAVFLGIGGGLLADIPHADATSAQCRRAGGLFCGSDFDRGFGGVFTGIGAFAAVVGALLMYFGTVRSAEIEPNQRDVLYLKSY